MSPHKEIQDEAAERSPSAKVKALIGPRASHAAAIARRDGLGLIRDLTTAPGRARSEALAPYKDKHAGQRCIIIGNGPSLNDTPMELLADEVTFGLNRIYMMFDELGFATTYHVVVNKYVVDQCAEEFATVASPLFTTEANAPALTGRTLETHALRSLSARRFSKDPRHGVWEGATVTFVAMQVAYFMGFSEVVLVGVDHSFASKGKPHQLVESTDDDPNHFNPKYFGRGFKWQLPDLEMSEMAYAKAREAFEADGRRIVDATVGGQLQIFPKADLAATLGKRS